MVAASPFLSPNFVSFAKKVNSQCLHLNLFVVVFMSVLILLCWESILISLYPPPHQHLDHHVSPPPPLCLCPRRWGCAWPFRSTWRFKFYLAGAAGRNACPRKETKRANNVLAQKPKEMGEKRVSCNHRPHSHCTVFTWGGTVGHPSPNPD
jgi:hypothetical protein